MSRLKNIKIYWNMHMPKTNGEKGENKFQESNCWQGNILMSDDGYFEGIVKSNRKTETETNHLVFGIINESVNCIYKIDDSKSAVHIFSFKDDVFNGICLENNFLEWSYGECKIELSSKNEENFDELVSQIKQFKSDSELEDYDFYYNMSKNVKKYFLTNVCSN